jgi:peptide/nickel transport system permease protein
MWKKFRELKKKRLILAGLTIYLAFCIVAIFEDYITPYGPNEQAGDLLQSPSREYLFGTDQEGRCVFSRIIHGTRDVLFAGITFAAIMITIGVPLGLLAGYCVHISGRYKGTPRKLLVGVDGAIKWVTSALIIIPWLVLIVALVGVRGPLSLEASDSFLGKVMIWAAVAAGVSIPFGLIVRYIVDDKWAIGIMVIPWLILAISIFGQCDRRSLIWITMLTAPGWAAFTRLTRGRFLALGEGSSARKRSVRMNVGSIFHRILPTLLALIILGLAAATLLTFMLGSFGLGGQKPSPSWGLMLSESTGYLNTAWWLAVFPGIAATILILGLYCIGDRLRKDLDQDQTFYLPGVNAQ